MNLIPQDEVKQILNEVFTNIINNRKLLKAQLAYEKKEINEHTYKHFENTYINKESDIDVDILKEKLYKIMILSKRYFNSEELSMMFGCSIEKIDAAIDRIASE